MKISKKVLSLILAILMVASCISVGVVSVSAASGDTIYLKNSAGWSNPTCYMWKGIGGEGNQNGSWPGVAMTSVGDNVYSYTLTDDYTMVVFNDAGGNKTLDRDYPGNNQIYDNSTDTWSVYDLDSAEPAVSASKKSGTTFKTATIDITVTATNADTASYSIDGGSSVPFTGSAVVTMGAYTPIDGSTSITVTAANKNGTVSETYTYTKKAPSLGGGNDGSTTPAETGKYGTNPNGAVGKKATITIDGDFSDWSEDMLIAQGAAWDVANHYKGGHENCVLDTYSLYGAWDSDNLYIGWQMVNTTDTWAREGDGPLSDGGRVLDVPLILALSLDESSTKMSNKNNNGDPIWGQKMGLTFTTHVDRLLYMSGKPGLGTPGMFSAVDDNGNTNYSTGLVDFKNGGIEYKMAEGCLPSSIIGLNYSEDPADVYNEGADWVDYKTFKGSSGAHDTKYDSFYEIKIPLSKLDIDADYLENNGIGAMLVATRGESGIDCIPHDPSMLDNAMGSYSADPSTSHEKDDEDNITVPFARIGKLLGSGDTPTPTATPPQTYPPTEPATEPQTTVQVTEPVTAQPTTPGVQPTEPIETTPVTPQPTETQPVVTEPIETTPVTPQPTETQPVVTDPIETQPVVTDPTETQPQSSIPATDPDETIPTEAPTTVAPTEAPTLPAEGTFHVVAGDSTLCNGVNWDPTSAFNLMTLGEDGVYSIVYENVPAGTYNFKVTTNGAWDVADFNLTGDAKFGGANATIEVVEDGSWVTITFKESDMHANAYINDVLVDVGATEPTTAAPTEAPTTEPTTEAPTDAPATVCNHSATKTTTTAATYFAKGKTVVTCTSCGEVIKTTTIAKKVLKTPTVKVKAAKKSIKVTLKKKVKNATGFVVKYQIKGKKKVYTKTYKSNKKVTKVIKKLKSNKKYTVKVRAYVKSGKKIAYSKWTKVKTVKVK